MSTRFEAPSGYREAPVSNETSFNGHRLSDHNIVVERVHDDPPSMRESLEDNVGRHGSSLRSLAMEPREIILDCRIFHDKWDDLERALQSVYGWLVTSDDRELVLRNRHGQYYMAHLRSYEEGERSFDSTSFKLTFVASDPLRYEAKQRYVVVQAGITREFEVGGTDEARAMIEVRNCDSTPHVELVRLSGNGREGDMTVAGTNDGSVVTFDCVNHIVRSNGSVRGVTLESTWPILMPGRWGARTSSGTMTLSWRQSYR